MSEFSIAWELSRKRLEDTVFDLNDAQLNWKLHGKALSIAQMSVHVAGVETSFISQLLDLDLDEEGRRLVGTATDGVVNDKPFPFTDAELDAATVRRLMNRAKEITRPVITNPGPDILQKQIVSALGPVITGDGALARLTFHSAYHQGQAYLIRTAPGFPS